MFCFIGAHKPYLDYIQVLRHKITVNLLTQLIKENSLYKKNELSISQGTKEVENTENIIIGLSQAQQKQPPVNPINCASYWNSLYGTFTYHTHTIVDDFKTTSLAQITSLFFNAYSLSQQEWYSQFVYGENQALPTQHQPKHKTLTQHQIGQGYFDFGLPSLRHYHTLFSLKHINKSSASIVLRSIKHPFIPQKKSKKVFLLAPTGDYFCIKNGQLHWHHICTVTGVSLLPGVADKYLMNTLRYLKLDSKERQTYINEAESFIQFASGLSTSH